MVRHVLVASLVLLVPAPAQADELDWLVGPVFGLAWGGDEPLNGLIGVEGGPGYGPERLNVGVEHRDGKAFAYLELDPWLFIGGSFGMGVDSDGKAQPVIGVWEGIPIEFPACDPRGRIVTMAIGYRYTGVHELYLTVKAGVGEGFCLGH